MNLFYLKLNEKLKCISFLLVVILFICIFINNIFSKSIRLGLGYQYTLSEYSRYPHSFNTSYYSHYLMYFGWEKEFYNDSLELLFNLEYYNYKFQINQTYNITNITYKSLDTASQTSLYLPIHFLYGVNFIKNKDFTFYIKAGLILNILIYSKEQFFSSYNSYERERKMTLLYIKNTDGFDRTLFAYSIKPGFDWHKNNEYFLFAQFPFEFHKSDYTIWECRFGINTGIGFNLDDYIIIKTMKIKEKKPKDTFCKNSIYSELIIYDELLNSILSINYERILKIKSINKIGGRIGIMLGSISNFGLPLEIIKLVGSNKHYFEIGVGCLLINNRRDFLKLTGRLGYRYQKSKGGVLFRIGFYPTISTRIFKDITRYAEFWPSISLSLGYSF